MLKRQHANTRCVRCPPKLGAATTLSSLFRPMSLLLFARVSLAAVRAIRCLEKVGWQRSNESSTTSSTPDWSEEGFNLLGNSTLIYLNEPEYAEDPKENYPDRCYGTLYDEFPFVCDDGQVTTCSEGLYADDATQTESPCLRGWHFFNLFGDGERLVRHGPLEASTSGCPEMCGRRAVVGKPIGDRNSFGLGGRSRQ